MTTSMDIRVDAVDDATEVMRKAFADLRLTELLIGVPEDADRMAGDSGRTERPATKDDPEPVNNAVIAYVMNNGSPAQNIPARPTLEPGIRDARAAITGYMEDGATAALAGSPQRLEQNLNAAGLAAQTAVRNRIGSNTPPQLSPRTLAARRRRGHTGEQTLYETGEYLRANTYVLHKKKR